MANKTPISLLHEVCNKRGISPNYELLANEGQVHEPLFVYNLTAGPQFSAIGKASNKKKARHIAAQRVLDQMLGNANPAQIPGEADSPSVKTNDNDILNSVGKLQEFAQRHMLRPPVYEFTNDPLSVPAQLRQFTCRVKLGKYVETARATSKKVAKRKASQAMLNRVKDLVTPTERDSASKLNDDIDDDIPLILAKERAKMEREIKQTFPVVNSATGVALHSFFLAMKSSNGKYLDALQSMTFSTEGSDYVKLLGNIAQEQNFNLVYVDITERNLKGEHQCLVQLSTMPVAVLHGSGGSSEKARSSAALNALQYLKIMTKKP